MSEEDIEKLICTPMTVKEYCVVGLLWGTGMRISELCNLRIADIDSKSKRIKIIQGEKGLRIDIHCFRIIWWLD